MTVSSARSNKAAKAHGNMGRTFRHALLGSSALVGLALANPAAAQTFVPAGGTLEVTDGQTISNPNGGAISAGGGSTVTVRAGGRVEAGGNGITYDNGTLVNEGTVVAAGTAAYFFGSGNVINAGSISSTGSAAIRFNAGGTLTNTGTISTPSFGILNQGGALTLTNYGTITTTTGNMNAPIYNQFTGMTLNLMAGSVVSNATSFAAGIESTVAGSTITLHTGVGSTDPGVSINGSPYVAPGARNAARVVGFIRLTGSGNTINLAGNGTGANDTGEAGTLSLSALENVNTINKVDSGTWTLTGLPNFSGGLVYNVGTSGADGGRLIFNGGGLTGAINVINGTIRASSPGVLGSSTVYATRGTMEFGGFGGTFTNPIILTAGTNEAFNLRVEGGNSLTQSGTITTAVGAARDLNFVGAGTIALTGANSWAGITTIGSGTTLNGNTGSIRGSSIVVGTNANLVYNQVTDGVTPAISGAGNLTKTGVGRLTLDILSSYTGRTTVLDGRLTMRDESISQSSGVSLSAASAILELTTAGGQNAIPATVNNLTGVAGSKLWISGKGAKFANSTNTIFAGTISGASDAPLAPFNGFDKTGTGKLTLTADNPNMGGSFFISEGTLALGNGGTTGSVGSRISVSANGTLEVNRSNAVTLDGVSGFGTINKIGTNVLTLTRIPQDSNFSGTLSIQNGSVAIGTATMLSSAIVNLAATSARLNNMSGSEAGIGGLIGVSGSQVDVGTGIALGSAGNYSYAGTLAATATGVVRKVGTGTQTFTRSLSGFGGDFIVAGGTLAFANGASAANSDFNISNFGTFSIAGVTTGSSQIASLTGVAGARITLGDNQLTIGGGTTTFGGSITGNGSVQLLGGTDLTLTGANNFYGGLNIGDGATLNLNADSVVQAVINVSGILNGPVNGTAYIDGLGSGGTVLLRGSSALNQASVFEISNGGYFYGTIGIDAGYDSGTLRLTGGTLTLAGGTVVSNISLEGGNLEVLGTVAGSIDVGEESNLSFASTSDSIYGSTLSGIGTITKREDSTLTLDGVSTFSGTLTVEAGTLAIGANGSLGETQLALNGGNLDASAGDHAVQIGTLNGGADARATIGSNTLELNNGGTFEGQISGTGGTVSQMGGTLILSGVNSYDATLVSGGTSLVLTGAGTLGSGRVTSDGTIDLALATGPVFGSLAGANTGSIVLGENTLSVGLDGSDSTFGGVISGLGGLNKDGAGVFTLSGINTYTGLTDVMAGTLRLGASGVLADASTLMVRNGATLDLNGFDEMVRRFEIQGNLIGTGSLSAEEFVLAGGSIDRDIEAGTITVTQGTTVLNGQLGGTPVTIEGGTLRIGASERLDDDAALVVESGGTFDLGSFDETLATAAIAGTIDGTGTLTAATYTLNGATVNGNLGTGALTQEANNSTLSGTSGAATVAITGGTLALGASDRLSDTAALNIATAGTLNLGTFSDTVGTAAIDGTLNGTGTLSAASYALNGAAVNGNLGTGTLTQASGTSTLTGTSAAAIVGVTGGTLALGATDRLSDTAALTVGTGGTLNLGTFSDTVGTAAIDGTLNGTGTLSAASYALNGATVNGNLGTGTLTQVSGTSTLTGTSAATTVAITGGTLALGGADRLSDTAALSVVTGGTLNLGTFSDTVGTAAIDGTLNGTGTLTAASYSLNGAVVNANLGGGALTQASGSSTLNGASGAATIAVTGGTLAVGNTGSVANNAAVSMTGGTLDLSAGTGTVALGTLGGAAGTVAAGSRQLTIATGGTFGGTITGTSGLTVASGTQVLTGNNSYTGATVLTGATSLTLGNGGTSGSVAGAIQTGTGAVTVNRSDAVTLAGPISGGGSFAQSGSGTTTLTGANSYTGGTNVTAGTLIGSASSISGDVQNAGRVEFAQAGNASFAGATRGAGTFAKSGTGNLTLTGTSASNWSVGAGTLTSASSRFTGNATIANGATLAFDQSGAGSYAGSLSGGGAFTVGGGTQLILTGNSSGFTGTTTVGNIGGANTLSVNGTLGGTLTVLTGGRLQGSGTIGNTSVAGTVAPGNSIGTLNVAGNFAFAAGSVYEVEANAAGESDRIVATGTVTIGSNVAVNVLAANGNYGINTSYTIVTGAGGVSGTFSGATSNLAFLSPTLTYGATSVTLNLRRNSIEFGTVGQTSNQRAIAPAVEQLGLGNTVYNAVVALTAAEARGAFDQLAGSEYASVRGSILEDSRFVRDAVLARGETAGTPGVSMWGRALGSWGHMDGNAEAQRYDRDVKGILTGFDGALGEHVRVGAAVGYSSTKFLTNRSQQDLDSYHAGGYLLGNYGALSFQLGGAYAWNDTKGIRRVSFGTINQALAVDYSTRTFQAFGEVAYKGNLGGVMLQPFAGVARVTLFDGQLAERGGSAALRGGNTNERVTFGTFGLRTGVDLGAGDLGLRFTGSAAVRHAFGNRVPTIDLAFATGPGFTAIGNAIEKNSIAADAGLEANLSQNVTLGVSYAGNYGKRSTDHGGRASISFRF